MSAAATTPMALFGGTFDPIHLGHIGLAEAVLAAGAAGEVTFIPARIPPHKQGRQLSSGAHRLRMVQLAIAGRPAFSVSDWELQRDEVSYTWHTADHFSQQYGERLRLLIGMDSLLDLPNWYRAADLVATYRFIVYRRPGSASPPEQQLVTAFGLSGAERLLAAIVDGPAFPMSSSRIRSLIAAGKPVSDLLPGPVTTYVTDNRLYQPAYVPDQEPQ